MVRLSFCGAAGETPDRLPLLFVTAEHYRTAPLSRPLRLEHRAIGGAQQALGAVGVVRINRAPDARAEPKSASVDDERPVERGFEALREDIDV
jgi:hypothetical protein